MEILRIIQNGYFAKSSCIYLISKALDRLFSRRGEMRVLKPVLKFWFKQADIIISRYFNSVALKYP
jgi:hypothetical protein